MSKNIPLNILGLMSGTSMDGINATVINTNGIKNLIYYYDNGNVNKRLMN